MITRMLKGKIQKDTNLELYKMMAMSCDLYGSET